MNSSWSVSLYRVLMHAYPVEFRNRYGESVDQAFRDMLRDAVQKHGYLGVALLWFHVVPDLLFSVVETLTSKAGDFLKWRFRLQWVVACSLGFALGRCVHLMIGREFFRGLETRGQPWLVLGTALGMTITMSSIGLLQSRVLAGRFFRKKQWVLYGLAGAVLTSVVLQMLLRTAVTSQLQLLRLVAELFGRGFLGTLAERVVISAPIAILGACMGTAQSAAMRNDAITRYRWIGACAAGYFFSAVAGGFVVPYPVNSALPVLQLILTSIVAGAILGLLTSGPLERILFNGQTNQEGRP